MTDVPPARQCTMPGCEREARDPVSRGSLCPRHADPEAAGGTTTPETTPDPGDSAKTDDTTAAPTATADDVQHDGPEWGAADFTAPDSDVYPGALTDHEQWMVRGADLPPPDRPKAPFAPWGTDGERARWGQAANRAGFETAREWLAKDPRADGLAFIQLEDDPFAFVDGDDVRCPETGEVHPAFVALLEHLGATYADVSTSGAGVHAYYRGSLPVEGKGQASWQLDTEPWGANDSVPEVEVYANKHVNLATGEHVPNTPIEVREWDTDALRAILEANGFGGDDTPTHDTDRSPRPELEDHDPAATTADETASDVKDVLAAVDRLSPGDVYLSTTESGSDATGWRTFDPSYRPSESGESLHYNGEGAFYDHKLGEAFGVLGLVAAEEGIISDPWDRLTGEDWWAAVDAARDRGADIPQFTPATDEDAEHTVALPDAPELDTATSGWDWRHAARRDDSTLSVAEARQRTTDAIRDAYETGDRVLIEALPTTGKSYGASDAVRPGEDQVTIVTGRGQEEQYEQFAEWCEELGLECKRLPAFTDTCSTAAGEHGDDWRDTVMDWYNRGATPQQIHNRARHVLGEPLPCQRAEDGSEIECAHRHAWNFDPDDYDVLIGHYVHAHTEQATSGRTVVFDEFPDAFESTFSGHLAASVSHWLERTDGVPFEDWGDLRDNRKHDQQRRAEALLWFEEHGVEPDPEAVFEAEHAHADAPLAVYTLLAGEDLGNGFEHADLGVAGTGVYNRETDEVAVLHPPELEYASGVVALDGTPTKRMWELALGERLNHRQVLADGERAEYLRDALNLNLVRTTEHVKPYNSPDHVATEQDAALLEAVADEHGQKPALITTATAEAEYDEAGVLDTVDETKHYGNILGSNEFDDTRLGAVIGSNHYGDAYIKKWGAYAGEAVEREGGKGADLSYTGIGGDVLRHMREHDALQAAMRFGRDGNGAVVYVHTDTLPEWVPLAGEGRVVKTWSDGMRGVIRALEDAGSATTAEVVDHPAVDISRQQVFDHLETLRERGVLQRTQDPEDGRRVVWQDDGVHRLGDHGEVDLDPLELGELTDDEVRKLARTTIYTWEFTNLAENTSDSPPPGDDGRGEAAPVGAGGDGPPPGHGG